MKYYLIENSKGVFIEDGALTFEFNESTKKWIDVSDKVYSMRIGFDPFEPEGSPYRYGNGDMLREFTQISEEEAIKIMGKEIMDLYRRH